MRSFYLYGAALASLSLILYSGAIYFEKKRRLVTSKVLVFLLLALALNIAAVVFMTIETKRITFSSHSIIGYTSLLAILLNSFMTVRFYIRNGPYTKIPFRIRLYSTIAYLWWIVAYITGGLIGLIG